MTISYSDENWRIMARWRGSLWKAILVDVIWFYIAYYIILFFQWSVLDEQRRRYFTGWIIWCEYGTEYIPLSFLLGFFVAVVVARWWEQFNWISWPDKLSLTLITCLPGEENLNARLTIARWSSLQAAIAWSGISVRTLKRFPTQRHLVDSGLMTEEEYQMYQKTEAPHGKWFLPVVWIINLIKRLHAQRRIDSIQLKMIIDQVYKYRDGFAMLFVYDWVKIPASLYTSNNNYDLKLIPYHYQVVAIATYGYFLICLVARQPKLDEESMKKEITIMFPLFTTIQMCFYLGWLKVGQYLMNPFGEDDDDFELNYVLDRNTYIAHMINGELAEQLPTVAGFNSGSLSVPHTRASFKIQDIIPKSHLSSFKLSDQQMEFIRPDTLIKIGTDDNSHQHSALGTFTRAIAAKRLKRSGEQSTEIEEAQELKPLNK